MRQADNVETFVPLFLSLYLSNFLPFMSVAIGGRSSEQFWYRRKRFEFFFSTVISRLELNSREETFSSGILMILPAAAE